MARNLLLAALLLAASAAHAEATPAYWLNRIGFGAAPGDVERVTALGADAYLEAQLHPGPEPKALQQRLDALTTTRKTSAELFGEFGPALRKLAKADEAQKRDYRDGIRAVVEDAEDAKLLRALYSPNQLQEMLVEFWFNHFNVFSGKGLQGRLWAGAYEREAIRPYVFGHFRDLLGATAKHPAMLFYLDNWRSAAEGFKPLFGPEKGKTIGLNENYAREVMELHTLGVDGGYNQHDVTELARILTGWTFDIKAMADGERGAGFRYVDRRHDHGSKVFLGQHFGDDGVREGERALDLLAKNPATAHHIAFELAQYFVADAPPPALVDAVAATFMKTDGDLRAVVKTLLTRPEFLAGGAPKYKTPFQYVVSTLRAADVDLGNLRPALGALRQMGQPVYGCATPDGWQDTEAAWLNPNDMLQRVSFATALGAGRLPTIAASLAKVDLVAAGDTEGRVQDAADDGARRAERSPPLDAAAILKTSGLSLSAETRAAIDAAPTPLKAALLLGSPEFMRR